MKHNRPFGNSVRDALRGVYHAAQTERNFRFELAVACVVLPGAFFVPLTMAERAGVWLCVFAVLVAELFNTAIEHTVDVATQEQSEVARVAKDTSAAAVLFVSIGALCYGCAVAWLVVQRSAVF